jgi:hypothetical protein
MVCAVLWIVPDSRPAYDGYIARESCKIVVFGGRVEVKALGEIVFCGRDDVTNTVMSGMCVIV